MSQSISLNQLPKVKANRLKLTSKIPLKFKLKLFDASHISKANTSESDPIAVKDLSPLAQVRTSSKPVHSHAPQTTRQLLKSKLFEMGNFPSTKPKPQIMHNCFGKSPSSSTLNPSKIIESQHHFLKSL